MSESGPSPSPPSSPQRRDRLAREAHRLDLQITHTYQAAIDEGVEVSDHVFGLLMDLKRWAREQAELPEDKPSRNPPE